MKYITPIFFCLLVVSACKKEDIDCPQESPTISKNAYYPLEIGNYWIYEFQSYAPDGSLLGDTYMDSLVVVGDTLIDDLLFKVVHTDRPSANSVWVLRDDEGGIVNQWGSTILPSLPTNELYNDHHYVLEGGDTLFYYYDKFPSLEMIETNFGEQECMVQEAVHVRFPVGDFEEVIDTSYFASFGPVQRSYAYLSGAKMIGILVDYHIE